MRRLSSFLVLLPALIAGMLLGGEKGASPYLIALFVVLSFVWLVAAYKSRAWARWLFWPVILLGSLLLGQIAAVPKEEWSGERYELKGVVLSAKELSYDIRCIVRLVPSRAKVAVHLPLGNGVSPGDRIEFVGVVTEPPAAPNPGAFCYRSYLRRFGANGLCYPEEYSIEPRAEVSLLTAVRGKMRDNIIGSLRDPALALALVLGERDMLSQEQQDRWRQLGTSHLLAISGMHVGLIALGLGIVIQRLPVRQVTKVFLTQLVLLTYVLLAGGSVSVWRAFLFSLFGGIAAVRGMRLDSLHVWAAIAWLLLLLKPEYLHDPSFVLSFGASGGILLWGVTMRVRTGIGPVDYVVNSLLISLIAQISILPFVLEFFQEVALLGPVATLLFVPLVAVLLISALLVAFGLGSFGPAALANLAVNIMRALEELLLPLARQWSPVGIGRFEILLWWLLFLYAGWRLRQPSVIKPKRTRFRLAVLTALVFVITTLPPVVRRPLEITAINVGQGDCYYVKTPSGLHLLIDGGGDSPYWQERGRDVGREWVVPYLQYRKVPRLDYVILSHPHEDHLFGLLAVLEEFEVGMVLDNGHMHTTPSYERYLDLIMEKGIPYYHVRSGDVIPLGDGISLEVLYPERVRPGIVSPYNNNSLLFKLTYGGVGMLFTGDLENAVLYDLARSELDLKAQWLKVPHHGSKGSLLPAFYDAVDPVWAVISTGPNQFGHPHREVTDFLTERQIKWRTTQDGAVTFLVWWGLFGRFMPRGY